MQQGLVEVSRVAQDGGRVRASAGAASLVLVQSDYSPTC